MLHTFTVPSPERTVRKTVLASLLVIVAACTGQNAADETPAENRPYDVVITNGRVVDGTGSAWFWGDIAIADGRIARIAPKGVLTSAPATRRIDANGMVVAPGFIDIQAQSYDNFMTGDGKALSMVTQGITTAILGEGDTPAPANESTMALVTDTAMKRLAPQFTGANGFAKWIDFMVGRGLSQNVGSFVGSGTVRAYAKGAASTPYTKAERDTSDSVIKRAMEDGAFGVASALMYPPDNYNTTDDLIASAKAMSPFGGLYITHMRNEGDHFTEAVDEAIRIGKEGGVPTEIYHLKAAGMQNWAKIPAVVAKIDSARAAGQDVQADMYLYIAGGNSFSACIAPQYSADGKLLVNIKNPALREQIKADLKREIPGFENSCREAPHNVMVVGFTKPELLQYEGKRLDEIATAMGKDWTDVIIDLNVAEEGRLGEILFRMSEDNVKRQIALPWMKFATDAGATDPSFASKGMVHPRTYGNFARLFGKYVQVDKVITLEEAVRKSSAAVATRLSINDRGVLKSGMRADVIIFDPAKFVDKATFEKPHQLSEGMQFVLVNGVEVLKDGVHTGAKPGVAVRGPGWVAH